ncbi:MAG: hypothetical protein UR25_C0003G0109 [Candidatus Nomurabacteria bacterium GW2011_GWE1_32_28]|uniref:Uncharacterized protein n=1 Tax=Candidatus Nomurabacteria bacterium GW2011_GWF1_31_48 TaxID=1618767 RepID=A0A0F9YV41_9BACT|nr:MAG: hypothetical protein UR10_C0003G0109 [Candidatus Nomurabacteria bacterium GW2011_GWF2_30_133]KKP28749.1 MAG: hypothetical protein UR18_C0002G0161 [Candidatus Nomurabacteria bacterium GW2011_GWE2_31_40]KKP30326.1 MAG: hypothetical protein UR19_C0003G0162 [Candidatus Nomurabacteria bacterium GW2011_GWF1_31_48]KKP34853.1 MAG: hypothetical protein UR25_C0003G0109 [Candidatus Nomurabacteria bacterium GW2011_GWE1_32_28]HAS80689.1 hypothetical protein [Candidatus Nomurabacteria bacterium]
MQNEIRQCQNCKENFTIESDDFSFYEKMKVPPPTFCSRCRMIRRMSFGNLNSFYKKPCEKCKKSVICLYPPNSQTRMYCNECWWKDDWDGTEYGVEYNPDVPFFQQLIELRKKSIFVALESLHPSNINTKYTNNASYQKNCFMTIYADYDENCAYTVMTAKNKDLLDCYRSRESEMCYECVGIFKCFNCKWSEELDNCFDCLFCQSCVGCNHCFGCVNLRNASYQIFNVQYSKEEYEKKLAEFYFHTYEGQQKIKNLVEQFWIKAPKREYHGNSLNKNVTGEYVYESKNTHDSYLVTGAEDCRFSQYLSIKGAKDCYDYTGWGASASMLYECYIVGEGAYNNKFCSECWPEARDIEYSYYCVQSKNCFGCVNLKRKSFCILNKQYSEKEYFLLKEKIINDMKKNIWKSSVGHLYTYGEFLPPELSPYGYNETMAYEYSSFSEEEAKKQGYNWTQINKNIYSITLENNLIPNSINEISENIKDEVIQCVNCEKGFNINSLEIELLKKVNQPIPHSCPSCRHERRFKRTNMPILYNRTCAKCNIDIYTPYSPDRPEIVYCVKCYQQEFSLNCKNKEFVLD